MTDSPSKTFHSFRHLFVALLRAAEVDESIIKALVGHTNDDVTANYGQTNDARYPIAVLKKAVEKISIAGLDLSHLFV